MELLKDYDCSILSHPGKANVVVDVWSRKSIGSLAHISLTKRLLAKDIQRLEGAGIKFSVRDSKALLACAHAKSSLVERIKATQYEDERFCKYRDEALASKSKDMIVESDGILRMGDRLCVTNVDRLRHSILEEAQNSRYIIHLGSTKMSRLSISDPQDCYNKLRFQRENGKELPWILSPVYHEPLKVMTLYG
ncbi:uncharacterized protein LOC142175921 [Nicotiana tabacum]|uniref:Uncharacterized protein LOC142175921 n=1 Tax=Nicotiana tabacum TaxID=4097 RepID=A0AC58TPA5_TOBAC